MTTASAEVQAAVDRLGASLGRAVLVEDAQHQPLWWSAQGEIDGTRMRTILQRYVEPAAAAVVARFRLDSAKGPVRTPAVPEADMLPRWCVPLRVGRDLFGYLWVLDPRRDGDRDGAAADRRLRGPRRQHTRPRSGSRARSGTVDAPPCSTRLAARPGRRGGTRVDPTARISTRESRWSCRRRDALAAGRSPTG